MCVALASRGYPASSERGAPISRRRRRGGSRRDSSSTRGRRCATAQLVTNGGRVLNVVATGESVGAARDAAYAACGRSQFDGMQFRNDIAARAAEREGVGG